MANSADLVFNILARDKNAKRTFKELQDEVNQLRRALNRLGDEGGSAGGSLAGGLADGFKSALSVGKSGPAVAGALIGAAVAASQPISALLSSAVLAGIGGGVIATGLVVAAKDPQVKKAASELSKQLSAGLTEAAKPFVEPLLRGIDLLGGTAKSTLPELGKAFEVLVPTVDKFFLGFNGFVQKILPGLRVGLEASKPILDAIADNLPKIGAAIGDAIKILSSDSDRLGKDMVILMGAAAAAIRATATSVAFLSDQFNNSLERGLELAKFLAGVGEIVFGWAPGVSIQMRGIAAAASEALAKYRYEAQWSANTTADTEDQVVSLKNEIKTLEGKIVEVKESGAADSQYRVAELQRRIDSLRGRVIEIEYRQTVWGNAPAYQVGYGKIPVGYRQGGITPIHAQRGLLSKAGIFRGGSPLYAFAEPGTGQEAFIPRNGDTNRSRGLARRVVDDWLGGPEKIWGGSSGGNVYNITVPVTVGAGASGAQIGAQAGAAIIAAIKSYEQQNGTGWRS